MKAHRALVFVLLLACVCAQTIDPCVNGVSVADGLCECQEGWRGETCSMCDTDAVCQSPFIDEAHYRITKNDSTIERKCDKSMALFMRRTIECDITDEDIASLLGSRASLLCSRSGMPPALDLQIAHPGVLSGREVFECQLNTWMNSSLIEDDYQDETPAPKSPDTWTEVVGCFVTDCVQTVQIPEKKKQDTAVLYSCKNSQCHCNPASGKCTPYVVSVIEGMRNGSLVSCNALSGICTLVHEELPSQLDLICKASECMTVSRLNEKRVLSGLPWYAPGENTTSLIPTEEGKDEWWVEFQKYGLKASRDAWSKLFVVVTSSLLIAGSVIGTVYAIMSHRMHRARIVNERIRAAKHDGLQFSIKVERLDYSMYTPLKWAKQYAQRYCFYDTSNMTRKMERSKLWIYISNMVGHCVVFLSRFIPISFIRTDQRPFFSPILKNINLTLTSGKVIAFMGASGCGKTTLTSIIGNRYTGPGIKIGSVKLAATPQTQKTDIDDDWYDTDSDAYKRLVSFVYQSDLMTEKMTVHQNIDYVARLRCSDQESVDENAVTRDERVAMVEDALELTDYANRKFDVVSGGQKRGVCIAAAAVSDPKIIILDEPISGLDAHWAGVVLSYLREMAKKNKMVILVVHQPSREMFELFDEVVFMNSGEIVYQGTPISATSYFIQRGMDVGMSSDPSGNIIKFIKKNPNAKQTPLRKKEDLIELEDFKQVSDDQGNTEVAPPPKRIFRHSAIDIEVDEIDDINEDYNGPHEDIAEMDDSIWSDDYEDEESELKTSRRGLMSYKRKAKKALSKSEVWAREPYATSSLEQFYHISRRTIMNLVENKSLLFTHANIAAFFSILVSIVFYDMKYDFAGSRNRLGVVFFTMFFNSLVTTSGISSIIRERDIFVREKESGIVRPAVYYLSKLLFEFVPIALLPVMCFCVLPYWAMGLNPGFGHILRFVSIMSLFNICSVTFGTTLAMIMPDAGIATVVFICSIFTNSMLSGFPMDLTTLPSWISWIKYANYWYFAFEALMINEFKGVSVYINPKIKGAISFHTSGEFILNEIGLYTDTFWLDTSAVVGYCVMFIILGLIAVCRFVYRDSEKR